MCAKKAEGLLSSLASLLALPQAAPCSQCQPAEAQRASPCFLRPGERRLLPRGLEQHQLVCAAEIGSGWDQAESVCLLVGYGGSLLGIIGSGAMARADGVALDALGNDLAFSLFLGELDPSVRSLIFVAGGHSTSHRKRHTSELPTAEGLAEETGTFFLSSVSDTKEDDKFAEQLDYIPCEELCRTDVRLPSRDALRMASTPSTAVAVMALYAGERIGEPFTVQALALPLLLEQRKPLAPLASAGLAQFQAALALLPGREPLPGYGPRSTGLWLPSPEWGRKRSWESDLVKPTYKEKRFRSSEVLLTALRVAHWSSSTADMERRRVLQLRRFIGSAQEALRGTRSVGQSLVYRLENWRRQALLLQQESRAREVVRLISALPTLAWLEDSLAKVADAGSPMPAGSLLTQGLTTPRTACNPKLRYGASARHSSALPPAVGIGDQPMKTPRDGATPRGPLCLSTVTPRGFAASDANVPLSSHRGSLSSRDLFLRATSNGSMDSHRTYFAEVDKEMSFHAMHMPPLKNGNFLAQATGNNPFPEVETETLPQLTVHPSLQEMGGFAYMEGGRRPWCSEDDRSNAGYSDSTWASEMDSSRSNLPAAAQGYWAQELQAQQELLRMLEKEPRSNSRGIATVLASIGVALGALGRHADARAVLERALRLEETEWGPNSLQAAVARMRLASAHAEEGGDTQRRAALLEGAVNVMDRQLGRASFEFASALMSHGSAYGGGNFPKLQSEAPAAPQHGAPSQLQDAAPPGPAMKQLPWLGEGPPAPAPAPAAAAKPPLPAFHIPLPAKPPPPSPGPSPLASPSSMASSTPRSARFSARRSASLEVAEAAERIFIEVSKQPDGPRRLLGLELDATSSGLLVKRVREGIVMDWNSKFPDQQVKVGDWVVEVNGIRGQMEMLHGMSSRTNLMIMFERRPGTELEPKALQEVTPAPQEPKALPESKALPEPKTLQPSEQEVARQKEPPRPDPRAKRPEPRVEQEAALDATKHEVEEGPLSPGKAFSHEGRAGFPDSLQQPGQALEQPGVSTQVGGSNAPLGTGFSGGKGLRLLDELEGARVATPSQEVEEPPLPDSSGVEAPAPPEKPVEAVEEQLTERAAASEEMPEMPAGRSHSNVPDSPSAFCRDDIAGFSRLDLPPRAPSAFSRENFAGYLQNDTPLPSPGSSSRGSHDSMRRMRSAEVMDVHGEQGAAVTPSFSHKSQL